MLDLTARVLAEKLPCPTLRLRLQPFGWRRGMPLPQDLGELWVNLSMAPAEAGLLPDPPARPASARAPKPLGPAAFLPCGIPSCIGRSCPVTSRWSCPVTSRWWWGARVQTGTCTEVRKPGFPSLVFCLDVYSTFPWHETPQGTLSSRAPAWSGGSSF